MIRLRTLIAPYPAERPPGQDGFFRSVIVHLEIPLPRKSSPRAFGCGSGPRRARATSVRRAGRICIHPHDPDLVYVAALGDVFGVTGESGFIAVHPKDPNIVYCGAIGSSPGGAGALQRYDHRTGQIQLVNVWPEASLGIAPKDMRYRFAWTYPIVFSPHDSGILYAAGNHVFRSRDEGMR